VDPIISNIARHILFRLVEASDAEFILSLRLDPEKSRFLSTTKDDIEAQRTWIQEYKEREKKNQEYYFIIENNTSEKLGVIRLYDFRNDSFCWGSWLLKHDAPPYAAIESVLSIYEIGLYRLGFNQSHTDVRKGNQAVLNFLLSFGAVITDEDELNYYFRMSRDAYEKAKLKYRRFLSSDL
jgi:RimJ/RimL family protein N-acetyltransferase